MRQRVAVAVNLGYHFVLNSLYAFLRHSTNLKFPLKITFSVKVFLILRDSHCAQTR